MKYLFICGASRSVVWFRKELIEFLINLGNEVHVVACDIENKDIIESYGVKFYCINGNNRDIGIRSNLNYVKNMSKLIASIQPDKVLTFQAKANTFGVIASKKAGFNDITAMVEGMGRVYSDTGLKIKIVKLVLNCLFKKAFKLIPTVIFLNEEDRKKMIDLKLVVSAQCMIINGIGVNINEFKQKNILPLDTIKFLMVARVEKFKGVYEYCEAAKQIIESGVKNVEFIYYGACDTEINIIDNYTNYIQYNRSTKDIKSVLDDNNIIVLPSHHEGVPRSLMEACAMSKPIIASNVCGNRMCVVDGLNGKLVEPRDITGLVEKMKWFIDNKDQLVNMGQAGRKIAEEKFDSEIINKLIYDRISK